MRRSPLEPVSWEHMGMSSNRDPLCRHPHNLWDASAMEVQATMPPLTLQNHRQTGGANEKHRDGLEDKKAEREMEEKGGEIVLEHILSSLKH